MKSIYTKVISFPEANDLVQKNLNLILDEDQIDLSQAAGRIASEDVFSPMDSPPFNRATMDGFALRSSETSYASPESPARFKVEGESFIGEVPQPLLGRMACMRISTGSMLPDNADCVVPVEEVEIEQDYVLLQRPLRKWENVAVAGSDIPKGKLILRRGMPVGFPEIAVLATLGINRLKVKRKLRIGIFSSGSELVNPGESLPRGKIFESNGQALTTLLKAYDSFRVDYLGIIKENYEVTMRTLMEYSKEYDIIVTSAGTSYGERDFVYRVLQTSSPGLIFHGVMVKPGMPTAFGKIGQCSVIALPGFPVSAIMIMLALFLPNILKAVGIREKAEVIRCVLGSDVKRDDRKWNLIPVALIDGEPPVAVPMHGLSGSISRFLNTSGYLSIEPGFTIPAGTLVTAEKFERTRFLAEPIVSGNISDYLVKVMDTLVADITYLRTDAQTSMQLLERSHVSGVVIPSSVAGSLKIADRQNSIAISDIASKVSIPIEAADDQGDVLVFRHGTLLESKLREFL
ncbi:molybdopterin molybdotransferase MoeA [Thermoplasmatales archaeon AK]|nr:molybdopterin molybdotransferase MoeA [Thermoplasmatales archaeon AK]